MTAFHTDGIERELFVDFIFLHGCIENFLLWICHIAIGIHEFIYHITRYDCFSWEIFHNHILDATNRLSAYAYINVGYFVFELFFQFADDCRETLCRFIDVINHSFPDALGCVFYNKG